jgi:TolB-like protein
VRNVLERSVRTAGDQIRVSAQLIDAESDQQLWSATYDRELSTANLFSIQDEIASSIVSAIRDQLGVSLEAPRVLAGRVKPR